MHLSEADRAVLASAEEITIETRSPGNDVHRTIIWVVVDGEDVFVRSVRGDRGRWYREALANPEVALLVDGRVIPAHVVAAADPDSIARCSSALIAKYRADPAIASMLRPSTLPTTLRVIASA